MKKIILIIVCIMFVFSIKAQTSYKQRRDWVVGHYAGLVKDSTTHTPWQPYSFDITYTSNSYPADDSTVYVGFGLQYYVVGADSTFLSLYGASASVDPLNTGKLYHDSTLLFHVFQSGPGAGASYFKGKKIQSYAGVTEIKNADYELKIYPNPVADKLFIALKDKHEIEFILFDVYGKEVIRTKEKEFNVDNLPEGIYFVQVTTIEGILTKKIVVQH